MIVINNMFHFKARPSLKINQLDIDNSPQTHHVPSQRHCDKDTRGLLQKLLSFRYQKPNQIPIEGTVSNPEFEPNQISEPGPDENRSSFDHGEVD